MVVARADNEYNDLFWALRGGGNSFALVTNFELKTIKAPKVMVGTVSYAPGKDTAEAFIDAVHDYTVNGGKDYKSATIPTAMYVPAIQSTVYSSFVFYNGHNESPAALKRMLGNDTSSSSDDKLKLTSLTNTFKYRSMYEWSNELDPVFPLLKGDRQRFYVLNIHASNRDALATVHDTFIEVAKESIPAGVITAALAFPAVGEKYIQASTVNGGDPMSLDPDGAPYIWVEESMTALATATDEDIDEFYQKANERINHRLKEKNIPVPKFTYINDANPSQDAFSTYPPENLQRLKSIRAKYDPDRVYTDLMPGGWKVDP